MAVTEPWSSFRQTLRTTQIPSQWRSNTRQAHSCNTFVATVVQGNNNITSFNTHNASYSLGLLSSKRFLTPSESTYRRVQPVPWKLLVDDESFTDYCTKTINIRITCWLILVTDRTVDNQVTAVHRTEDDDTPTVWHNYSLTSWHIG